MKKLLACLILIQSVLLSALAAKATNEFAKPLIYPPVADYAPTKCQLVTIQSVAVQRGQTYSQSGVGWVILGDEGYRILTPAHVISGADTIQAECQGKIFALQVVSKTETKDLALLKFQAGFENSLFPLIELKQTSANSRMATDHFRQAFQTLLNEQIYNLYVVPKDKNTPWFYRSYEGDIKKIGIAHLQKGLNTLAAETLAIRPGFSGSPLLIENPVQAKSNSYPGMYLYLGGQDTKTYLVGMLNKVEVNGSRSLGLSLPDILQMLPLLWNAKSWVLDVYSDANNKSLSLRYKNTVVDQELERSQELVFKSLNGDETVYKEICIDANLESSAWTSKGKDLSMAASRGGDYGEGGGGSASLRNSVLMTTKIDSVISLGMGNLTSFKRMNSCDKVMLQDNRGNLYDAFKVRGQLQKATSLSELYDLLASGEKLESAEGMPICRPVNLESGWNLISFYQANGKKYYHYRGEGSAKVTTPAEIRKIEEKGYLGFMRCYDGNLLQLRAAGMSFRINVALGDPKRASGGIQFGGDSDRCGVKLTEMNYHMANRWKHQIRSRYIDVDISVGTKGRIVGIKFLKVPNECQVGESKSDREFWMGEQNFFDYSNW
jgi:hypothetical protein